MRNQTIRFYNAVYQEFPHSALLAHMDAIASGKVEYWRNAGIALLAIAKHSVNKYGRFNPDKYEMNRARLDALRQEFAPDVMFQS